MKPVYAWPVIFVTIVVCSLYAWVLMAVLPSQPRQAMHGQPLADDSSFARALATGLEPAPAPTCAGHSTIAGVCNSMVELIASVQQLQAAVQLVEEIEQQHKLQYFAMPLSMKAAPAMQPAVQVVHSWNTWMRDVMQYTSATRLALAAMSSPVDSWPQWAGEVQDVLRSMPDEPNPAGLERLQSLLELQADDAGDMLHAVASLQGSDLLLLNELQSVLGLAAQLPDDVWHFESDAAARVLSFLQDLAAFSRSSNASYDDKPAARLVVSFYAATEHLANVVKLLNAVHSLCQQRIDGQGCSMQPSELLAVVQEQAQAAAQLVAAATSAVTTV